MSSNESVNEEEIERLSPEEEAWFLNVIKTAQKIPPPQKAALLRGLIDEVNPSHSFGMIYLPNHLDHISNQKN